MKAFFVSEKLFQSRLFLFMGILVLGMTNCIGSGFPADIYRENLTLEEAQSLVTFPICIPAYLPVGIMSEPQINYDTDSPDIPELTWIRLVYKRSDSSQKVFEVSQRFTNDESMNREYPDFESEKLIMLWWILPTSDVTPIAEQVEIQATSFQTQDLVWWLYEITEPLEYQSTMTRWIKNNVEYQVSAFLSVDEIKEITESMFECIR